jgi:hypothetical protein
VTQRVTQVLLATLAVATASAARGAPSPAGITTTATGARALAWAGVGAAPPATPEAVQSNPAALAFLAGGGMTLAHRVVAPGVAMQGGTIAIPAGRAAFALDADIYRVDGSPVGSALGTGRDATFAARGGVHAAVRLPGEFAVGAGVARYSSSLTDLEAHGWCTDAGLAWQRAGWRAGAALRGWSFAHPAPGDEHAWSAGAARAWRGFDLAAQVDGRRNGDIGAGGALAWRVLRALELRGGAHHDAQDGDRFGAGLAIAAGATQLEWGCRFGRGRRSENSVALVVAFGPGSDRHATAAPQPKPQPKSQPRRDEPAPTAPAADESLQLPDAPEDTSPKPRPCYSVTAGTHPNLETASAVIFKLRAVDLRATVERRAASVLVVVQRCVSESEAKALHARVTRAGIRASIITE